MLNRGYWPIRAIGDFLTVENAYFLHNVEGSLE